MNVPAYHTYSSVFNFLFLYFQNALKKSKKWKKKLQNMKDFAICDDNIVALRCDIIHMGSRYELLLLLLFFFFLSSQWPEFIFTTRMPNFTMYVYIKIISPNGKFLSTRLCNDEWMSAFLCNSGIIKAFYYYKLGKCTFGHAY
jgi:hypothetical protein